MLENATVLAGLVHVIAAGLREEYGVAPEPILEELGVSLNDMTRPGARISVEKVDRLWERALEVTGDSAVGIRLGRRVTPADYYVLGHAWFASETLRDALERYSRYSNIVDTVQAPLVMSKEGDEFRIGRSYEDPGDRPSEVAADATIAAVLSLCEAILGRPVELTRVDRTEPQSSHAEAFAELVRCPVNWGAGEAALYFKASELEEPLHFAIPDVAEATDRVAERYIESLDKNKVATQVRRLLIQMLPAGPTDQERIASRLYRSASTLQRQLSAEGTSYRDVLEATRRSLAQDYLRNGEHTHAQIAYMLGFSDQSNFARAFKRWTGKSPGKFQKAATT